MLIGIGHMKTDPSLVEELARDLRAGVEHSLTEDGCIFYSFALDDPAGGTVLVSECWRDLASLEAHLATPELQQFLQKWGERIEVDVMMYDATNPHRFGH